MRDSTTSHTRLHLVRPLKHAVSSSSLLIGEYRITALAPPHLHLRNHNRLQQAEGEVNGSVVKRKHHCIRIIKVQVIR